MRDDLRPGERTYFSIYQWIKDTADPEYVAAFEKSQKRRTVYVYVDGDFVQVFKKLTSAKKFAEGIDEHKNEWVCKRDTKGSELWALGAITINECQTIEC